MKPWQMRLETTPRYRFFGIASAQQKVLASLALILATGVLAWKLTQAWQHQQAHAQMAQKLQSLQRQLDDQQAAAQKLTQRSAAPTRLNEEQRRGLNQAIRQLNTPWSSIFEQIEQATPQGIALIQIEPDGKQGIKIQAESKDLDQLLAYAASLQNRGIFGSLVYSKHDTNEQDANKPVRLSFQLSWAALVTEKSNPPSTTPAPIPVPGTGS
jgi:Tfp pilus assembly protein PilN